MKKMLMLAALAGSIMVLASCATPYPLGIVYTEVKLPIALGDPTASATKCGVAECQSVLGLVATGDASIGAACRNGGIKKIIRVEYDCENILGVIGKYRTTVYGE